MFFKIRSAEWIKIGFVIWLPLSFITAYTKILHPSIVAYYTICWLIISAIFAKNTIEWNIWKIRGWIFIITVLAFLSDFGGNHLNKYLLKKIFCNKNQELIFEKVYTNDDDGLGMHISYKSLSPDGTKKALGLLPHLINTLFYLIYCIFFIFINYLINYIRKNE